MTSEEIKSDIQKIVESLPESCLPTVLKLVEEYQHQVEKTNVDVFLEKLNREYGDLLSKLAK